jgi:hypothetical protein
VLPLSYPSAPTTTRLQGDGLVQRARELAPMIRNYRDEIEASRLDGSPGWLVSLGAVGGYLPQDAAARVDDDNPDAFFASGKSKPREAPCNSVDR